MPVPMFMLAADDEVQLIAVAGGLSIAVIAIVAGTIKSMAQTKAREQSRREIAAYVAEGTISPDDAAKLLASGEKPGSCGDGTC